jgi:hypothetical protein
MLVATTLLVVIMLGLTAMFIQTQKAFRSGFTQTDVNESGRFVVDMIARDFQQMSDAKDSNIVNMFYGYKYAWNQNDNQGNYRTNYLSDMFTLEHINNTWYGVGYAVSNTVNGGISTGSPIIGTLYRYIYTTNDTPTENPIIAFTNLTLNGSYATNFHRLIDGVIHMRVRAFDPNGNELRTDCDQFNPSPNQVLILPDYADACVSNYPIPSSIEIELGILEPAVVEQVRSLGTNVQTQQSFLTNRMGAVHIFRQQIPVRTALPR